MSQSAPPPPENGDSTIDGAPTISVAICTHNGAPFIERQLRSIFSQSVQPDEIVLSDDASSDGTLEIARKVVSEYRQSSIVTRFLINETPLGVTRNFEHAITHCSGSLIVLCDQDDLWMPTRIASAVSEFSTRHNLDLLFANATLIDGNDAVMSLDLFGALEITPSDIEKVHSGRGVEILIKRNIATGATVMFDRRILSIALPFPPDWLHDEWLAIVAVLAGQVDLQESPSIKYRQHGSNVVGVKYPSLSRKVRRVFMKRGDRNGRLARQYAQLSDRITSREVALTRDVAELVHAKATFEADRQRLSHRRIARVIPIFVAARAGKYRTFASQGQLDILRDLLQPR